METSTRVGHVGWFARDTGAMPRVRIFLHNIMHRVFMHVNLPKNASPQRNATALQWGTHVSTGLTTV
jgi:hypothetical protein